LAETAAWCADNNRSIYELLQDIYVEYGFSKEVGLSVYKEGKSGAEEIEKMMKNFREHPQAELAGSKVVLVKDFLTLKEKDLEKNEVISLDMPTTSNVLQYYAEDETKVSIRPSGTESKIKFYIEVKSKVNSRKDIQAAEAAAIEKIAEIRKSLGI
jgi:Phosphomannomutase